jgi:hypothetical protein
MVWGRHRRDGWPWVNQVFVSDDLRIWSARRKATFAFALPFEPVTWDWVEAWGEEVAAEYWRKKTVWFSDVPDAPRAIRTLLDRGRPFAALHIARSCASGGTHRGDVGPELLLAILRAITAVACGQVETSEGLKLDSGLAYEVSQLLSTVEKAGVTDEQEIARIEWIWLPALDHVPRGPVTLQRALAREPGLFAQMIELIYRPSDATSENPPIPEPDELTRGRATHASKLLEEWRGVPGLRENGSVDGDALRSWVQLAREALERSGHVEIGNKAIGTMLARVPPGADGVWPHESVRELLEELRSDDIERGLFFGVINNRGMSCRSPTDGGEQEMALVQKYENWATALMASTPRTARVLRQLAKNYRADARREDDQRDLNEFWR